jgi:hypothetical protein
MLLRLILVITACYSLVVRGAERSPNPEETTAGGDTDAVDEVFDEADVADDVYEGPSSEPSDTPTIDEEPPTNRNPSAGGADVTEGSSPAPSAVSDDDWGDVGTDHDDVAPAVAVPQHRVDSPLPDPCTGVTCGGHGNCTIVSGDPTCACFSGFIPDGMNGLTCIVHDRGNCAASQPLRDDDGKNRWRSAGDDGRFEKAFPGYNMERARRAYERAIAEKAFDGPLERFLETRFKRLKVSGLIVLSSGVLGMAGAVGLHVAYGDKRKSGLLAGALVVDLLSLSLMAGGAVMVAMSESRTKQLKAFEKNNAGSGRSGGRLLLPSFFVSRNGAGAGLDFQF